MSDAQQMFAVKDREGVAFYLDEKLTQLFKRWERWRWDCPATSQRWHHVDRRAYRLVWKRF